MGTTLDNGIYLPDEGERNCYEGLAGNWVALDNHLGSTNIHVTINDKQAWDGHIADTTIHVTSADKQSWNGHVADTTIHVTSADKQSWNGHVADLVKHVTAEDKSKWDAVTSKANDSDVVHKSGNETISGVKTFSDNISTKKIISNVAQLQINARSNADSVAVIAGADASEGGGIWLYGKNSVNKSHVAIQVYDTDASTYHAARLNMDGSLTPTVSNNGLGSSSFKWKSFNGLNPSALGMPDLSNGVDISSYITVVANANKESLYTPPANGWISVRLSRTSGSFAILLIQGGMVSAGRDTTSESGVKTADAMLPVVGGVQVSINSSLADSVVSAYFYPCQGNV